MRNGSELDYSFIWISRGIFFEVPVYGWWCFIGYYEFSISERMEMKDRPKITKEWPYLETGTKLTL